MRNRFHAIALSLLATVSACRMIGIGSDQKIDSGAFVTGETSDTIPGVMKIRMEYDDGASSCTATATSANTIILAAHCVTHCGKKAAKLCIDSGTIAAGKCTSNIFYSDGWGKGAADSAPYNADCQPQQAQGGATRPQVPQPPADLDQSYYRHDFAIAVFEPGTFKNYFNLGAKPVQAGEDVALVGYSVLEADGNRLDDAVLSTKGSKRWGASKIQELGEEPGGNSTIVTVYGGAVTAAGLSSGDSGGPMFNKACEVIGVASRSSNVDPRNPRPKFNLHTNILADNKEFIEASKAQGAHLCGLTTTDAALCPSELRGTPLTNPAPQKNGDPTFPCASGTAANAGAPKPPTPAPTPAVPATGVFLLVTDQLIPGRVNLVLAINQLQVGNVALCEGTAEACQQPNARTTVMNQGASRTGQAFFVYENDATALQKKPLTFLIKDASGALLRALPVVLGQ